MSSIHNYMRSTELYALHTNAFNIMQINGQNDFYIAQYSKLYCTLNIFIVFCKRLIYSRRITSLKLWTLVVRDRYSRYYCICGDKSVYLGIGISRSPVDIRWRLKLLFLHRNVFIHRNNFS